MCMTKINGMAASARNGLGRRVGAIATAAIVAGTNVLGVMSPQFAYAETGSVTITSQANDNATYDAYRLFTADVEPSDGRTVATNVAWDSSVSDEARTAILSLLDDSSNGASQTYGEWLVSDSGAGLDGPVTADMRQSAQNAAGYISAMIGGSVGKQGTDPVWVNSDTFADQLYHVVASQLTVVSTFGAGEQFSADEGYYLFATTPSTLGESNTSDVATAPIWFVLGGEVTSVVEKATSPTISKEVKEDSTEEFGEYADAETGQDVTYKIVVTMPGNYNTFDTFYAGIDDVLPAGMTMDTSSVKVMVGDADVTSAFSIDFESQVLTIVCSDTKEINPTGESLTVTYDARMEGEDVVYGGNGNRNTATFTYSNNPNSSTHGTTTPVDAVVYSYVVTVDKLDSVTGQALEGAQFKIRNSDGLYLLNEKWVASADDAQVFTTDSSGAIQNIRGLDAGEKYTLVETKAPDGYQIIGSGEVGITVNAIYGDTDKLTGLSVTVDAPADANGEAMATAGESAVIGTGTVNVDVDNDRLVSLAMTGGAGVSMAGVGVVAAGLGWWLLRARRQRRAVA